VFFYFPRICNHCLNPSCVAACPSGALYKRGEDGIVLLDQNRCRGWRACVPACPYKKTFYNWSTGKSEKCILCFPRIETGQAPACFHSCVGRIRYLGVLLYDADRIAEVAASRDEELIDAHRSLILDPNDPVVVEAALRNGVHESVVDAAQRSPVYKFVKVWKVALPPHIEFRTLPMLFYVPPMSPVMAQKQGDVLDSPFWWACWTASQVWRNSRSRRSTERAWRSANAVMGSPSTYSMTKYGRPSSVMPASRMRAMWGWLGAQRPSEAVRGELDKVRGAGRAEGKGQAG
jgi:Fe-S-cluster-containing dehydrogenase component